MTSTPAPSESRPALTIDVVADMVCPWCYLGWKRLKAALAMRPEVQAKVTWRPYQLDPNIPEQGVDRRAHMAKKFPDQARLKEVHDVLMQAGAEDGVDFHFDRIAFSPNTLAAHRLIRWAQQQGLQDKVVDGLFVAYFTEGRDIGDPEVLAEIGVAAGMDRIMILDLLSQGVDAEVVAAEHQIARDAGVTGVPFMIFDSRFSVIGAESPQKLVRAIDHAIAHQNDGPGTASLH